MVSAPRRLTRTNEISVTARVEDDFESGAGIRGLRLVSALCLVGVLMGALTSLVSAQGLFMLFGASIAFFSTLPFWAKRYNLMSPWTLLSLALVLSCGIRGTILTLGWEGRFPTESLWTLGKGPTFFAFPTFVYCAAVLTAAAIYMAGRPPASDPGGFDLGGAPAARQRVTSRPFISEAIAVVYLFALVGAISFYLYVNATGGFSLDSLSAKRTTIDSVALSKGYESHGALRFINQFSSVAFWVAIALRRTQRVHKEALNPLVSLELGLLGLNAVALPFYASSRAEVMNVLIVAIAIRFVTGRGGLRIRTIAAVGVLALLTLSVMTYLRATGPGDSDSALTPSTIVTTLPEGIIYDRNFGDFSTTAQIIQRVPEQLEYADGSTLATWLVAPIPRTLWPEKPLITAGPIIGTTIYGTSRSGVPPGYVAEFYWNFGLPGALLGGAVLGGIVRALENYFKPARLARDPILAVFYCATAFRFGMFAVSGGLGSSVYRFIGDAVTAGLILVLVKRSRARSDDSLDSASNASTKGQHRVKMSSSRLNFEQGIDMTP